DQLRQPPLLAQLGEVEPVTAEVALENLAADGDTARALLELDPVADLLLGTARLDKAQPILTRRLMRRGDDLHRVAAAQAVAQGHHAAVDSGAGAVVADLGVHTVGKVDDRRA